MTGSVKRALYDAARALVANPMDPEARAELNYLVNWKTCNVCTENKHIDEFGLEPHKTDGRRSDCKSCRNESQARRRAERKER